MQFTTTYMLLFALFSTITMALPLVLETRDVYAPPVLYPNANTIWKVGSKHNVTWDNSSPPKQITNPLGSIQLRKGNTTLPQVLASGFNITSGKQEIHVPNVQPGNDYCIVLMGDSGNFSPVFEIEN